MQVHNWLLRSASKPMPIRRKATRPSTVCRQVLPGSLILCRHRALYPSLKRRMSLKVATAVMQAHLQSCKCKDTYELTAALSIGALQPRGGWRILGKASSHSIH